MRSIGGELYRYASLGVATLGLNLLMLFGLTEVAGLDPRVSGAISLSVLLVLNFLLADRFIFPGRRSGGAARFSTFVGVSIVMRLAEYAVYAALSGIAGVHYMAAMVTALVASNLGKFLLFRNVVFRATARQAPEAAAASATATRESRDRDLFNDSAERYAAKDLVRSVAAARRARAERTLAQASSGRVPMLLEIGCGAGHLSSYADGRYLRYVGIDYAESLIAWAASRYGRADRTFVAAKATDAPDVDAADVVVMIGVLHHMADAEASLRDLVRRLKPGCRVVANEPQRGNPLIRALRTARTWINRDYSDEQVQYTAKELRDLFENAGLTDIAVIGQGLFATPFAEVVMPAQSIAAPIAALAVRLDGTLERVVPAPMLRLSWNLIASGSKPM